MTFRKPNLFKDDERLKQARPGLPIICLHRLLQRFSMRQTKQNKGIIIILQMPAKHTKFSAVETRAVEPELKFRAPAPGI